MWKDVLTLRMDHACHDHMILVCTLLLGAACVAWCMVQCLGFGVSLHAFLGGIGAWSDAQLCTSHGVFLCMHFLGVLAHGLMLSLSKCKAYKGRGKVR